MSGQATLWRQRCYERTRGLLVQIEGAPERVRLCAKELLASAYADGYSTGALRDDKTIARQLDDLREKVATLTRERDKARKTASIYATGYSPDHLSDTEHESAEQLYGPEVADALFPEAAPTPTEPPPP